jgi:hypothetical protein
MWEISPILPHGCGGVVRISASCSLYPECLAGLG